MIPPEGTYAMSQQEIADVLGLSKRTIAVIEQQALAKLARGLKRLRFNRGDL